MALPKFTVTGTIYDVYGHTNGGELEPVQYGKELWTRAKVTFTPNVRGPVEFESELYVLRPVVAEVMSDGSLKYEGRPVTLVANSEHLSVENIQYKVEIQGLHGGTFWIDAEEDGETVDLSEVTPVNPTDPVGIQRGPRGFTTTWVVVDEGPPRLWQQYIEATDTLVGEPVDILPDAEAEVIAKVEELAPGMVAAEVASEVASVVPGAVDDDLAGRNIGFVDEGDGKGHFTVGGVPVSGTLVPPAATWSGVAGIPDLEYATPGDGFRPRLYVDPVNGDDGNGGATWATAFETIQAAFDAAEAGAEIVLAPTSHDVGDGVEVDAHKLLTVRGAKPLQRRQHADPDNFPNQAYLYSSSGTKPDYFIKLTNSGGVAYGWTFQSFYIDADTLAIGGAGIEAKGVSRAIVEDVVGRVVLGETDEGKDERYLVKSYRDGVSDASWWTFKNCVTYGMRGVHATGGNYFTFPGCSFMGVTNGAYRPAGPAVYIQGTQPNLNGLHLEGWQSAGYIDGARGAIAIGLAGEWNDTLLHLKDCYDALVIVNSKGGGGNAKIVDEDGYNNTIIGANDFIERTGEGVNGQSITRRGSTPNQLAGGFLAPVFHTHPTIPNPGYENLPHLGMFDAALVGSGILAEYHDGEEWKTWSVDTHPLHIMDTGGVTIDATHKHCRFVIGSFQASQLPGLIFGRLTQIGGGTLGTVTVTTYTDSERTTVGQTYTTTLGYDLPQESVGPSQVRGFLASLRIQNGHYVEVEFDLGLTGGQTATLSRLHAWSTGVSPNAKGARILNGHLAPEGVVTARVGDFYFAHGNNSSDTTNPGIYRKLSGTGNTGWGKAVFVPATPPSVTGSKGGNAALSSLITQLASLGIITDGTS